MARSATASSAAAAGFTGMSLLKIAGFLAFIGLIAYGAAGMRQKGEDPHFLEAKKILKDYELGRNPAELNYDDETYPAALTQLGLVDPASKEADPAHELAIDINARILAFRQRSKERQMAMERSRVAEAARTQATFQAQNETTGTDPMASARATADAKKQCLEDEKPKPKRKP